MIRSTATCYSASYRPAVRHSALSCPVLSSPLLHSTPQPLNHCQHSTPQYIFISINLPSLSLPHSSSTHPFFSLLSYPPSYSSLLPCLLLLSPALPPTPLPCPPSYSSLLPSLLLLSPALPPTPLLGVVDHGIFAGFTTAVIVAGKDGVRVAGAGGEKPWW
jgi:hypothetical protein